MAIPGIEIMTLGSVLSGAVAQLEAMDKRRLIIPLHLSTIVVAVSRAVFTLWAAAVLEIDEFGAFMAAYIIASAVIPLANVGSYHEIPLQIADHFDARDVFLRACIRLLLVASFLGIPLAMVATSLSGRLDVREASMITTATVIGFGVRQNCFITLISMERDRVALVYSTFSALAFVLVIPLYVAFPQVGFAVLYTLVTMATAAATVLIFSIGPRHQDKKPPLLPTSRAQVNATTLTIIGLVPALDALMLTRYGSLEDVALYALAGQFAGSVGLLFTGVIDHDQRSRINRRTAAPPLLSLAQRNAKLAVPAALVAMLAASIYGLTVDVGRVGPLLLTVLLLVVAFTARSSANNLGVLLVADGRSGLRAAAVSVGLLVNTALNFVAIPTYGVLGCAAASVVGDSIVLVVLANWYRKSNFEAVPRGLVR